MNTFTTKDIKAGDPIFIATMGSWDVRIEKRTCTRVTPTGRVIYEYGGAVNTYKKTFGSDGKEIGGSSRHGEWLVSEERYQEHMAAKARTAAERQIKNDIEDAAKMGVKDMRGALIAVLAQLEALGA